MTTLRLAPAAQGPAELARALADAGVDPSALDPAALARDAQQALDPALVARGAEQALDPAVQALIGLGATQVVIAALALALVALLVRWIRQRLRPDERGPGATWAAAALACVLLYALARLVDPLLASLLDRPAWFPAERWDDVGWFEWKALGEPALAPVLPLARIPSLALAAHLVLWGALAWLLQALLRWLGGAGDLTWDTPRGELPWFYRWVGASTARRADRRFRRYVGPLLLLLLPLHGLVGLTLDAPSLGGPAPGTWVVAGLLLWTTAFHLTAEGRRPAPKEESKETGPEGQAPEASEGDAPPAPTTPLARLRAALEERRPGVAEGPLERRPAAPGRRADFPPAIAPLVREVFEDLAGDPRPWAHQAEVLAHLASLWSLRADAPTADVTDLAEIAARSPIAQAATDTPHALVIGGEGSGRTTLTLLAALHVFLDRGATTLVLVRTRAAARRWQARLGEALVRSSARWNVQVAVAGEDLAAPLLAGRTPAIVVADLEAFEAEILCNRRTDDLLARLGLVIADDVDAFFGVAEIHLQMAMRRLWALLATLHAAPFPVVLLATVGPGPSGLEGWARHVLAAPLRAFGGDLAPARERLLLRRRDLVDERGDDVPLHELAAACEAAGLPWHLRLAGDGQRAICRADFDLGGGLRHHRADPADAAVVLIEGTYPEVHREADRLAHAGWREGQDPLVMVLAPPADEEMVLHEEAEDAPARPLIAALPHAVPLGEPRIVRQRHLDRALGREQDLDGLRERLGAAFVDEAIEGLAAAGKVSRRPALHLDPRSDEIAQRTLVRAGHEVALGTPIIAECVTEAAECATLVDAGTSEPLLRVEAAIAAVAYPPGRVFLHPRGRYLVVGPQGDGRTVIAEPIAAPVRTTLDRRLVLHLAAPLEWSERQLGGHRLALALTRAELREEIVGVRRLAPGPVLLEHRRLERPPASTYGTDLCLVRADLGDGGPALASTALAPLCAALRMVLPCALRSAGELVGVDALALPEGPALCFYDRTPGATGFSRHIAEHALGDLLRLARLALGRLVGPERARLWHLHDTTPESDPRTWDGEAALRWLAAALDPRPVADAAPAPTRPQGPRIEHAPGDARGHLGRLWVSQSGRADDLVWTRHAWVSAHALAGAAAGEVALDVAVERALVNLAQKTPAAPPVVATLAAVRDHLHRLAGPQALDAVLGLCAAIPLAPRPLPAPQRHPLVVLARRRADLDAKLALAAALVPADVSAAPVGDGATRGLQLTQGGRAVVVDLRGPRPRALQG